MKLTHETRQLAQHANELNEVMLEYRRKHWKVKVEEARYSKDYIDLSTTSNGYQWSTISMMPEELDRVIAALEAFRAKAGKIQRISKCHV